MGRSKEREKGRWLSAVGQAVRQFRSELGLSQEKLGADAGLHRTYVSDMERGKRNPTAWTLQVLAKHLGKSPSDILREAEKILEQS